MNFINNLDFILKNKNKGCVLDVYILQKKNHIYIAFNRALTFLENTGEILKYADQSAHKINFHV